mmetsp:Transcript_84237/g.243466  ORF Transcript_84237/g.243466 Transcript_84237/m.243466 type:complete len:370 (-) Transcript_84237:45-1154(-)
MCVWIVKSSFVHAVDLGDEDVESNIDESPRRIRASSDGMMMQVSWALSLSTEGRTTSLSGGMQSRDVEGATTSTCSSGCGPSAMVLMLEAIEVGGDRQRSAIAQIIAELPALIFEEEGSRVSQRALELATPAEARGMARQLHGSVLSAARSSCAQLVLQQVICLFGTEDAAFIAEELTPGARGIAQSGVGGDIVARLLECSSEDWRTIALTDRILEDDLPGLFCHKFGHNVAVSVLSNGLCRHKTKIITALLPDVQRFARHRFGTRVLEAALLHCSHAEQALIARAFMQQSGAVASLACHAFGVHVVRAMLEVPVEGERVKRYIVKGQRRVRKDRYGLELLQDLGVEKAAGASDGSSSELADIAAVGGA